MRVLFAGALLALVAVILGGRLSERPTAVLLGGAAILAGAFVARSIWCLGRSCSPAALCREYQRRHPEDKNALDAALALEALSDRTDFQEELLGELRSRSFQDDALWKSQCNPVALTALLALCGVLAFCGRAAWRRFAGALFGKPALEIAVDREFLPRHADAEVVLRKSRYPENACVLESRRAGEGRTVWDTMTRQQDGTWHATLFDLTADTRYRVTTSNATSRWRELVVYDPPVPKAVRLTVVPPEYSGLPTQDYGDFRDLELLAGSRVEVACVMPEGFRWELRRTDSDERLIPPVQFLPQRDATYAAHFYASADERIAASGPSFQIALNADQPPLIELLAPQEDAEQIATAPLPIAAFVSDDFGIREVRLRYSVDDQPETTRLLWSAGEGESPKNADISQQVDFPGGLLPGQVVVGSLEAVDNCSPTPNGVRSPLFFLTVVSARESPPDGDLQAQNSSMDKQQEMSVDDLIAECKRLIRGNADLQTRREYLPESRFVLERQELSRGVRSLAAAVEARQVAVAKNAGLAELPGWLREHFLSASEGLSRAGDLLENDEIPAARRPQSAALSHLTKIAQLLLQNAQARAKGGESSSASGADDGRDGDSRKPSEATSGNQSFDLEVLQQALAEIREIRKAQGRLLEGSQEDWTAVAERTLATRTAKSADLVAGIATTADAVTLLRSAVMEMTGATDALSKGDSANAALRGARAVQSLLGAEKLLEEAQKRAIRNQIEHLSDEAAELSEEQSALAERSKAMSERDDTLGKAERTSAQSALQEKTRRLREEVAKSSQAFSKALPQEESAALSKVLSEGSGTAVEADKAQSRAKNALLYQRYGRAEESQRQAAGTLQQWSSQLRAAAGSMTSSDSPEELAQALEDLQRHAEQIARANTPDAAAVARSATADALRKYGEKFGSGELQELGEVVATAQTIGVALGAVEQARELIRQRLRDLLESHETLPLRNGTTPPKKYRPQTQEYFRKIRQ